MKAYRGEDEGGRQHQRKRRRAKFRACFLLFETYEDILRKIYCRGLQTALSAPHKAAYASAAGQSGRRVTTANSPFFLFSFAANEKGEKRLDGILLVARCWHSGPNLYAKQVFCGEIGCCEYGWILKFI
jgi:hypothetical protein